MTISDLKSEKGVKEFDDFISSRSYVDGYVATQADIAVLEAIGKAPGDKTPHAKRWFKHISSFSEAARSKLPGQKKVPNVFAAQAAAPASKAAAGDSKDDDDEVDLFGSDEEEDAEAAKIREERLKAYADKKSKKPALIAKSSVILEVKPWDDTTNMKEMETHVRSIAMDGLVWGASKLVPVGYGIHKLQIICIVEDEKVSIDDLQENIQEFEDFVQSVDVVGFNKI